MRLRRRNGVLTALGVAWALGVATGVVALTDHAVRPGAVGAAPAVFPASSGIELDRAVPTLVMFIHPRCPCSSASVDELARLVSDAGGRLRPYVVAMLPEGAPASWAEAPLVGRAAEVSGVAVIHDPGGELADQFGAATSGHTCVFTPDGRMHFSGGITPARGHRGDSVGRDKVLRVVRSEAGGGVAPVFGCGLVNGGAGEGQGPAGGVE